jgi:hypothetical protein
MHQQNKVINTYLQESSTKVDKHTQFKHAGSRIVLPALNFSNRCITAQAVLVLLALLTRSCSATVYSDIDMAGFTASSTTGFIATGAAAGDRAGYSLAGIGDFNKDGYDDVIIGAPIALSGVLASAGVAYILLGHGSAVPTTNIALSSFASGARGVKISGWAEGDTLGWSTSGAGDINHDGFADVIIGAPAMNSGGQGEGQVFVIFGYRGPYTDIVLTAAYNGYSIIGNGAGIMLGYSVSSAGDFNHDGHVDLIIGAPGASHSSLPNCGFAYLRFGHGNTTSYNDILVDASNTGASTAGFFMFGAIAGGQAGTTVAGAGDVNHDGFDDVVVGAPYALGTNGAGCGIAYVVFGHGNVLPFPSIVLPAVGGTVKGFQLIGSSSGKMGISASRAGDFNGDGYADILVGAYQESQLTTNNGAAYLIFGHSNATAFPTVDGGSFQSGAMGLRIMGGAATDGLGYAVACVGDVNLDGKSDIIVGAIYADSTNRGNGGVSYVIFGKAAVPTGDLRMSSFITGTNGFLVRGQAANMQSGQAVNGAGDFNGDGVRDLIIGAPVASVFNTNDEAGNVFLLLVPPPSPSSQPSTQPSRQPSRQPTVQPSRQPSGRPTSQPTVQPSRQPSSQPSRLPSSQPSARPSGHPTGQPSRQPSAQPSRQPTGRPTSQPTVQPTRQPSSQPSRLPTTQPTRQPTRQPTSQPSAQPTSRPVVAPTIFAAIDLNAFSPSDTSGIVLQGGAQDIAGYSVSRAGDFNGDHIDDYIVGAPLMDLAVPSLIANGAAFVVFGHTSATAFVNIQLGTFTSGPTGVKVLGESAGDYLGFSVSAAGDVNKDGYDDVIIGAPFFSNNMGRAYVVYGYSGPFTDVAPGTYAWGTKGFRIFGIDTSSAGYSVSGAGDVNNDGYADVIVGVLGASSTAPARTQNGAAYVIFGMSTANTPISVNLATFTSGTGGIVIIGAASQDRAGKVVSGFCDVNRDGFDDVLVGAPIADILGATDNGAVYVIFGHSMATAFTDVDLAAIPGSPNKGFMIYGTASNHNLGTSLSCAGDFNGDGYEDLVIGAPGAAPFGRTNAGEAYVFLGHSNQTTFVDLVIPVASTSSVLKFRGAMPSDFFGRSASRAGDLNGDGRSDIIVSAHQSDPLNRDSAGTTYVIFGRSDVVTVDMYFFTSGTRGFTIFGMMSGSRMGFAVSGAGDVNRDGVEDILIGTDNAAGTAYLLLSQQYWAAPTSQPSRQPSRQPTSQPSTQPSLQPSMQPSRQPTSRPSMQPTSQPSRQPSGQPTRQPSRQPTSQPTVQPSIQPTVQPTAQPSHKPLLPNIDMSNFVSGSGSGAILKGRAAGDHAGYSVSHIGDFNKDGISDVIIGSPRATMDGFTHTGMAHVLLGHTASATAFNDVLLGQFASGPAGFAMRGDNVEDRFGQAVSGAGDVNNDGFDDVIVGAPQAGSPSTGRAYVIFGFAGPFVDIVVGAWSGWGTRGFRISGIAVGSYFGTSVSSAGDVNKDGYDDVVVGGTQSTVSGRTNCGLALVVFGRTGPNYPDVDLTQFSSGATGFLMYGAAQGDFLGTSVSTAGDLNKDGYADLLIGAPGASITGRIGAGAVYVVFGHSNAQAFTTIDVVTLDTASAAGFKMMGSMAGEAFGSAVAAAGDVNGDGYHDVVIGAPHAAPGGRADAGVAYIVFGNSNPTPLTVVGAVLSGAGVQDLCGTAVASVGDMNRDGYADIVIGAPQADPLGRSNAGNTYVLYGGPGLTDMEISTFTGGSAGFKVKGKTPQGLSGWAVSGAGDFNNDGAPDLLIGAYTDILAAAGDEAGQAYLLLSPQGPTQAPTSQPSRQPSSLPSAQPSRQPSRQPTMQPSRQPTGQPTAQPSRQPTTQPSAQPTSLPTRQPSRQPTSQPSAQPTSHPVAAPSIFHPQDMLTLTSAQGFQAVGESAGYSVSSAGDFNGDHIDDYIIGAPFADQAPAGKTNNGAAYILLGHTAATAFANIQLDVFSSGTQGMKIVGEQSNDLLGSAVSGAGDVNNDGFDDVIIGAWNYGSGPGRIYVIFGFQGPYTENSLTSFSWTNSGFRVSGAPPGNCGAAVSGAGDVNGDGYDDVVIGCPALTTDTRSNNGVAYVIFGRSNANTPNFVTLSSFTSGADGFKVIGAFAQDRAGTALSGACDVNGDGYDDVLIGAPYHDGGGMSDTGAVYVIFGHKVAVAFVDVDLASIPASGLGFRIYSSTAAINLGYSVSCVSSFNGDRYDDVLMGAPYADPYGRSNAGAAILWLGHSNKTAFPDLVTPPASTSTILNLLGDQAEADFGVSVASVGDVNGDGKADILIGANQYDAIIGGSTVVDAGAVYVVFGYSSGGQAYVNLDMRFFTSGKSGYILYGAQSGASFGYSVAGAGDVDHDGVGDLLIGSNINAVGPAYLWFSPQYWADPTSQPSRQPTSQPSRQPSRQPTMQPSAQPTSQPIVRPSAQPTNQPSRQPSRQPTSQPSRQPTSQPTRQPSLQPTSHPTDMPTPYHLIDMATFVNGSSAGLRVKGRQGDNQGYSVSSAGDFNGDGFDDIIVGSPNADLNVVDCGQAYVIFGHASAAIFGNIVLETFVSGPVGIRIRGESGNDLLGAGVGGVGDVNKDGFDDVIISAWGFDSSGGIAYVLFGHGAPYVDVDVGAYGWGSRGFRITGMAQDGIGTGLSTTPGDVNGDGYADIVVAAPYADALPTNNGEVLVLFGHSASIPFADVDITAFTSGTGGFTVHGRQEDDQVGLSVAMCDVNGDGYDDVIIGAPKADSFGYTNNGAVYVLFGHSTATAFQSIDLNDLVAMNLGYVMYGITDDEYVGQSVACAGDFNGDGIKDIVIGAPKLDYNGLTDSGAVHVRLGRSVSTAPDAPIAAANNKYQHIYGAPEGSFFGQSVAGVGDINGDGRDDVLIGAHKADPANRAGAGVSYVIFGRSRTGVPPDILISTFISGRYGFVVYGGNSGAFSGFSVSGAGDFNGDGTKDILIGAYLDYYLTAGDAAGQTYVLLSPKVQWPTSQPSSQPSRQPTRQPTRQPSAQPTSRPVVLPTIYTTMNLAGFTSGPGSGVVLTGNAEDSAGFSVSKLGDFNGDGFDDVLVSSPYADFDVFLVDCGAVYVLLGPTVASALSSIQLGTFGSGANGVRLLGQSSGDQLGYSVSGAGDVNRDGKDDIIVGAPFAELNHGRVYVIFGYAGPYQDRALVTWDWGTAGFRIDINNVVSLGGAVSRAGDVNGDGFADVIVGVNLLDELPFGSRSANGGAFVVFGHAGPSFDDVALSTFSSDPGVGFYIKGAVNNDAAGNAVSGACDVNGDGYDEVIVSASSAQPGTALHGGIVFVIFGHSAATAFTAVDLLTLITDRKGFVLYRNVADEYMGVSVSCAGDFNGDGYDDIIIGTPRASAGALEEAGNVDIWFGHSNHTTFGSQLLTSAGNVNRKIRGAAAWNRFGYSVSGLGDINGDGRSDVAIGAPNTAKGTVYVIFGKAYSSGAVPPLNMATFVSGKDGFIIDGISTGSKTGYSVSGAGDFNRDGVPDLLIGAPEWSVATPGDHAGKTFLVLSPKQPSPTVQPTGQPSSQPSRQPTRQPTRQPGGQPSSQPSRQPTRQPTRQPSAQPTSRPVAMPTIYTTMDLASFTSGPGSGLVLTGAAQDFAGFSVSRLGDFNGDGFEDVLVASPYADVSGMVDCGAVYVLVGPTVASALAGIELGTFVSGTQGVRFHGENTGHQMGYSVSGAGDVNGDGKDDIIVGAPFAEVNNGRVYVIFGYAGPYVDRSMLVIGWGTAGFHIDIGEEVHLGGAVSGAGDVNGDGFDDVIVGANQLDELPLGGRASNGGAFVVFGHGGASFTDVTLSTFTLGPSVGFYIKGGATNDYAGNAVSGGCDVNGDGYDEVIVSASSADAMGFADSGAVYVIFGHSAATAFTAVDLLTLAADGKGFMLYRGVTGEYTGVSVSCAGDFNGDGYDDIVIGSPRAIASGAGETGGVDVWFGHSNLTAFPSQQLTRWTSISRRIRGAAVGDRFGYSVSGVGDINGDGHSDVVIGAPDSVKGTVYVLFGQTYSGLEVPTLNVGLMSAKDGFTINGISAGSRTGYSVSGGGDFNRDGVPDLLIGAPEWSSATPGDHTGKAFLVLSPKAILPTSQPTRQPSSQPSRQPSTQPTPHPTEVPSPFEAIDMAAFTNSSSRGILFKGESGSYAGYSVSRAGDFNKDGINDIIIGASNADDNGYSVCGSAYIVLGHTASTAFGNIMLGTFVSGPLGLKLSGEGNFANLGYSVSAAGDVNGDGFDDVVIGSPGWNGNDGRAYVVFGLAGPYTGMKMDSWAWGTQGLVISGFGGIQTGGSVSGAGDVNGDGFDDVMVASPICDGLGGISGTNNGAVHVFYGKDGGVFPTILISQFSSGVRGFYMSGGGAQYNFGYAVAGGCDINGDGYSDMIIGAPYADIQALNDGAAYVVFGRPNLAASAWNMNTYHLSGKGFFIYGSGANQQAGTSVSCAGDFNGDHYQDVIIGIPNANPSGRAAAGRACVVFGHSNQSSFVTSDTNTASVLCYDGANAQDQLGAAVSRAGDINLDGIGDVIIGAPNASPPGRDNAGKAFVLFGRSFAGNPTDMDLLAFSSGARGFVVKGAHEYAFLGSSVSGAGDFNHDGADDLLIGAFGEGVNNAGEVLLLLSTPPVPSSQPSSQPSRQPSGQPSRQPIAVPSGRPTCQPTVHPSSQPTRQPSGVPTGQPVAVPSGHPTGQPSELPSSQPSRQPTSQPTAQPWTQPTSQPSRLPTTQPSTVPTGQPTIQPTTQPSSMPSAQPTSQPSRLPTSQPSRQPSVSPSAQPSMQPTSVPSRQPTGVPSSQPTTVPSAQPFTSPSGQPTAKPSSQPTSRPSAQPSGQPSALPSRQPSLQPTGAPTAQPTMQPSAIPTIQPSTSPSAQPSVTPTGTPSSLPSAQPTATPSSAPSTQPSSQPSSQPSALPSVYPSVLPTAVPSAQPSSLPSAQPSERPTQQPNAAPSAEPSSVPSTQPTIMPSTQPSAAPSSQPSAVPTAQPSALPSGQPISGPSSQPSTIPSAVPTSQPSVEPSSQPTAHPTAQPSSAPSSQPAGHPTAAPTRQPTSQPSAHPSRQPSSQPSAQPSRQPSSYPTTQAFIPTFSVNATVLSIARTTAHLQVTLIGLSEAYVYCAAFPGNGHTLRAVSDIYAASNGARITSGHPQHVIVTNLTPVTSYAVYCTAKSLRGADMPLQDVLYARQVLTTACCKEVWVETLVSSVVQGSTVSRAVRLSVVSLPSSRFTLSLATISASNSVVSPAVFFPTALTVTNASAASLSQTLYLTTNQLADFDVTVTLTGPAAAEYLVVYKGSTRIRVVTATQPPSVPVVQTAVFSGDGSSVLLSFDSPTDQAGAPNTFACGTLLSFTGAASAFCVWSSTSAITIYPKFDPVRASSALVVGGIITVLANKVRAQCPGAVTMTVCNAWEPVTRTGVLVQAPTNPVRPTVIIVAPAQVGACNSLTLDLTTSVGSGGRPWASLSFQVSTVSGSITPALELQRFLQRNYTVSPPTPIPAVVLPKGETYNIQVALCNFLGACGSNVKVVSVSASEAVVPVVNILGPSTRTIYRKDILQLSADAYTQPCAGGNVYANLAYRWAVAVRSPEESVFTPTAALPSTSQNPAMYKLPAYTLAVGAAYQLSLTVTSAESQRSTTVVATVFVAQSNLVASIAGGSHRYAMVGDTVTLDALSSYDQDYPGLTAAAADLVFQWYCVQTSPSFTSTCPFTLQTASNGLYKALVLVAALNTTSVITVTVTDGKSTRNAIAQVQVLTRGAPSPTLVVANTPGTLTNVNTAKPLALIASLGLLAPCTARWSASGLTSPLEDIVRTSTTQALQPVQGSTVPFNLVVEAGMLPQRSALTFTLSCGTTTTSVDVTTNGAPLPGLFTILPQDGNELDTPFMFSAAQWTDSDLPLTYQFAFLSGSSQANLVIVSKSEKSYAATTLPAGAAVADFALTCTLSVFDSLSSVAETSTVVTVNPLSADARDDSLTRLIVENSGSIDNIKQVLSVVSTALNSANCTAAPDCAALNRRACAKTAATCSACLSGYVGDIGDRNTVCIPSYVTENTTATTCQSTTECAHWQECDIPVEECVTLPKTCAANCSSHGACMYVDRFSGNQRTACTLSDTGCDAVCACTPPYTGLMCELDSHTLQKQREIRSNLITSLGNLTRLEDVNPESVASWSASLYSLSLRPHDLSVNDVRAVTAIANTTLHHALALGVERYQDVLGVLQATDAVASLLRYNYNPNDYNDPQFTVVRCYINNTAAEVIPVVSAFADLVSHGQVYGEPKSVVSFDSFELTSALVSVANVNASVSSGATDSGAVVTLSPLRSSPAATVGVKMVTMSPRSYTQQTAAIVATPMRLQIQAQDDVNAGVGDYLNTIEFTFQHNEPQHQYVHYEERDFTSTCTARNTSQTFVYHCPDSEHVIRHNCSQGAGVHVSYCPRPTSACTSIDYKTAAITQPTTCRVRSYNATYTTCLCDVHESRRRRLLRTTEQRILDATGAGDLMASTVYIASDFADTFNAAEALNSPSAVSRVLVVIVMMGTLWVPAVIYMWYDSVQPQKSKDKTGHTTADAKARVLRYVQQIIPIVYATDVPLLKRLWGEIAAHHTLFRLITSKSAESRRDTICNTLTVLTFMVFLTAVFFDVSNPGDDGSCAKFVDAIDCEKKVSPFDASRSYCTWSTTEEACAYNSDAMSMKSLFYLTVLTTVLSSMATVPVDYCFRILNAPTAQSLQGSKVIDTINAVAAGVRRMSNVGINAARRMTAAVSPAPTAAPTSTTAVSKTGTAWSFLLPLLPATDSVIANRELSEEFESLSEEARKELPSIAAASQAVVLQAEMQRNQQKSKSVRLWRTSQPQHKGSDDGGAVEDLRGAEAVATAEVPFVTEILLQRMQMNDLAEETLVFDAQWGIGRRGWEGQQCYILPSAEHSIQDELQCVNDEFGELTKVLPNYSVQHAGLEILHLFMMDLLGKKTVAAKIFKEKFGEEFGGSQVVLKWHKYAAALALVALNAFCIYFVLLKGVQKGQHWQLQFLVCCLVQITVDLLVLETTECIWLNFTLPRAVAAEVSIAAATLTALVETVVQPSAPRNKKTGFFLNAAAQLFVSVKLARSHPQLLESMIVGTYTHHLPGQICKTWPHCKAAEETREVAVTKPFFPRSLMRGFTLVVQMCLTTPYVYQRVILRLVQPVILSGVSIVWFVAIHHPIGISVLCGLCGCLALYAYYRRYAARRAELQRQGSILPVATAVVVVAGGAPPTPVPTFIETFDVADDAMPHNDSESEDGNEQPVPDTAPDTSPLHEPAQAQTSAPHTPRRGSTAPRVKGASDHDIGSVDYSSTIGSNFLPASLQEESTESDSSAAFSFDQQEGQDRQQFPMQQYGVSSLDNESSDYGSSDSDMFSGSEWHEGNNTHAAVAGLEYRRSDGVSDDGYDDSVNGGDKHEHNSVDYEAEHPVARKPTKQRAYSWLSGSSEHSDDQEDAGEEEDNGSDDNSSESRERFNFSGDEWEGEGWLEQRRTAVHAPGHAPRPQGRGHTQHTQRAQPPRQSHESSSGEVSSDDYDL